jgi:hypothetical protein
MTIGSLAFIVAGFFTIALTAAITVQTIVAWTAITGVAIFAAIQVLKHISSDKYRMGEGDNTKFFILEASVLGLFIIFSSNFLFETAM